MTKAAALARRIAKRSLGRWVWRETYCCMKLPWHRAGIAAASIAEPAAPVDLRRLERSELQLYSNRDGYDFSAQFLDGLASRDDLCFGAFCDDKLVSYCFFAIRPTAIDSHLRFHFPLRWIYVYKAFTRPEWRGRRLQQLVFLRALPQVSRWLHGLREPLGFVTLVTDNPASLNAFARLGFTPFESFSVLRIRSRPVLVSPHEEERTEFYIEVTEKKEPTSPA